MTESSVEKPKEAKREKQPANIVALARFIAPVVLLSALVSACGSEEKEGGVAITSLAPTAPKATETIPPTFPTSFAEPSLTSTVVSQPEGSPTPQFEVAPVSKPVVEFADGIDQQTKDFISSLIENLPPLGNTRIQVTRLDREAFWPNKDGMPTLEVGVAGFFWQRNLFHGLAHAYDPSLNPEIAKLQTPEQNSHLKQAIETALADPFWGEALAPDKLYSSAKDLAATHPEMRGEMIDEETLNAAIRLRADGAYIGRSSEYAQGKKAEFIFGSEFLDIPLVEQFAQQASKYNGAGSISEFVAKNSVFLDQLSVSSPFWRLAVEDIRANAPALDNYEWSRTQISLPVPLKFDDQSNARSLLTFGDLVLRDRFLRQDPELLGLLSTEQQASINIKFDERISAYRRELLAGGLGYVLLYEYGDFKQMGFEGVNFGEKIPVEHMRMLVENSPYFQVYLQLPGTTD